MAMSKKDFIALAEVVREQMPRKPCYLGDDYFLGGLREWESIREALADFCAQQNPRFKRDRWLGYIAGTLGPNGGKR